MKIGIISSMASMPWGGSEELWFSLGKVALKEKIEVSVCVFDWDEVPDKITKIEKLGAKVYFRSRISFSDIRGKIKGKLTQLFAAEKQLHQFVKKENPDFLFVSTGAFCDLEIDSLRAFLLKVNIPFYIVVHSNNDTYSLNYSKISAVRDVSEKAKKIFFVADKLRQQAERQIAFNFKNSDIVHNPINMDVFGVLDYLESDIIQMACVGTIQFAVKGQSLLLQILNSEKWRNRKWVLNIYGTGVDLALCKELIEFFGLSDKVFIKGHVKDIRTDIWAKNHILLMPSFIEGMPLAMMEAMLCGRTLVATDVGGVREIVEDELTGFISQGATYYSFENALERAWQKKVDWAKMGENAFNKAMNIYKTDPIPKLLHSMLNDLKDSNKSD